MRLVLEDHDLAAAERQIITEALAETGSIVDAARLCGITRHAMKRRIVKHRIPFVSGSGPRPRARGNES